MDSKRLIDEQSLGQNAESAMLVASLRDVIHNQAQEIERLQNKLQAKTSSDGDEVRSMSFMVVVSLRSCFFSSWLP